VYKYNTTFQRATAS